MRVCLLILALAIAVNGNWFKDVFDWFGKGHNEAKSKLKEVLDKFGSSRNRSEENFGFIRRKLKKHGENFRAKFALSKEASEDLKQKLKNIAPLKYTKVEAGSHSIAEINTEQNVVQDLYEGDIVLTVEQANMLLPDGNDQRKKRQAAMSSSYPETIWKTKKVPYTIDGSIGAHARKMIYKGIGFWRSHTCISFYENGKGNNSLRFVKGNGCYSYIGRVPWLTQQEISLGEGCESIRIVTHEIAHALGFYHGQSRHDRDGYVTINLANVQKGLEYNYAKETKSTNENYGQPYEYGSVMHYDAHGFAINVNVPAMVAKNAEYQYTMGSGREPSFYDVLMMNKHYGCFERCSHKVNPCQNGGYLNPDSLYCTKCNCPSGYGGPKCAERPPGCGSTVVATSVFQTLNGLVGDGATEPVDEFAECNYWITAPANKKIEVKLLSVGYVCSDGCYYGGVEFKAQKDKLITGYRYCCDEHAGRTIRSADNFLPIILFNRYYYSGFQLQYRYV